MSNVRTVSDTKRAFYTLHTRPINSIYRRVVEELMVEMHLLSVNADYRYDPIYALGVVTTFDRFMQGYRPEADRLSIFSALCRAIESDPQHYRQDAEQLQAEATELSAADLVAKIESLPHTHDTGIQGHLRAIAENPQFKYSRLFAIGLYTLLESADAEIIKDEKRLDTALQACCQALDLSFDKVKKDLELYRSNLEKIEQARIVLEDMLAAERKKREQREQEKTQKQDGVALPSSESSDN
ncbi:MAG: photosystem II biogenesis protein Psp29 [Synechococcales bacterium]|nr:photosystem II biogenesis protein Psp29 [Synechococcales bacterium]